MVDITALTDKEAEELLREFPWFDIPLLALHRDKGIELPARLAVLARFRPALASPDTAQCLSSADAAATRTRREDTLSIIDGFINSGEHRITASDLTPEDIPGLEHDELPSDDLLTEELASIYLAQGLMLPAVEIYRKLSLLNPEKSVYFAKLIEKASAAPETGKRNKNN